MQRIFLAIDIGASSGRHIVGIEADGALQTDEVYRFPNGVQRENGHLIWDIEGIFQHVKAGIKAAFAKYPHIDSLSIDTWAVDYVLLKDGAALAKQLKKEYHPVFASKEEYIAFMDQFRVVKEENYGNRSL